MACGTGFDQSPTPPCDKIVPVTLDPSHPGNTVDATIDGGYARIVIRPASNVVTTGTVTGSTDPTVVTDGTVTLTLGENDVLYLHFSQTPATAAFTYVCGPRTNRSLINCGA